MNGRLVNEWMKNTGKTGKDLADLLDVDPSTLWRHLSGRSYSKVFVLAIAQVTGCDPQKLVTSAGRTGA